MPKKKLNKTLVILLIAAASIGLLIAIYFIPPVHSRLSWRVANLRSEIIYFFNPPSEVVFSGEQEADMAAMVNLTQTAIAENATATPEPTSTPTNFISPTPTQTATPTPIPTSIPEAFRLEGVKHEYQNMNNCGPATLSMALSYWGWDQGQTVTGQWLRRHPDDRNVMPDEMVDFTRQETEFDAIMRWGGDIEMIKKFIAAGYPVIVERGVDDEYPNEDWLGHYGVVTAYDDQNSRVTVQDSLLSPDYPIAYNDLERYWRAFNFVYVVIFPPEREPEILSILGPHADETFNHEFAAQKALQEIDVLEGRELFFAWFNYGTSLVNLGDYPGAMQAYDVSFFEIYPEIPAAYRPWRMLWYQTGPYKAYYHTGRFQVVENFATTTLAYPHVQEFEESWLWRGRARLELGNVDGAIEDFRAALKYRPGWDLAETELRNLGVEP